MPFLQSRRTRLVLFVFLVLFTVFAGPSLARSPYERTDQSEGDPGDGVLNPRSLELTSEGKPPVGGNKIVGSVDDRRSGRPTFQVWRFPMSIHVPVAGWCTVAPLWLHLEGRWTHAP